MLVKVIKERIYTFHKRDFWNLLGLLGLCILWNHARLMKFSPFVSMTAVYWFMILFLGSGERMVMGNITFPKVFLYIPRQEKGMKRYIRCQILVSSIRIFLINLLGNVIWFMFWFMAMGGVDIISGENFQIRCKVTVLAVFTGILQIERYVCARITENVTGTAVNIKKSYQVWYYLGVWVNVIAYLMIEQLDFDWIKNTAYLCVIFVLVLLSLIHVILYERNCVNTIADVERWVKE